MVFARLSTSSDATRAGASATAFLRASRSFHAALDQTKGRCRSDAFSFGRWIHPRQVNPAVPSLSRLTPAGSGKLTGCAITAAPVHFIPARSIGANRRSAHTFAVTPASQRISDLDLHSPRPFQRCLRAGFQPSEASNGRVPKHQRAVPKSKGELPNVVR